MTYIELDDTNSNKYAADGSEAKTDGTEGDVFVKLPTFYYRGNDTNEDGSSGDNVEIKFADGPFEDSVKWDTNILIGAYELYKDDNNKLHSISNVMTTCDMSYNDMNNYAKNMGNGYQLIDWRMHCVIGCLFYALYGNTNSRKVLGRGMYETMENGYTNSIGMTDTVAETSIGETPINFLGLENWYGHKEEIIGDMISLGGNTVLIKSNDIHEDRQFLINSDFDYGKHYRFGKYLDLSCDTSGNGSNNTYYCDMNSGTKNENYVAKCSVDVYNYGGISSLGLDILDYMPNVTYSSRLAFRGICTKAESVETFKSLPVI